MKLFAPAAFALLLIALPGAAQAQSASPEIRPFDVETVQTLGRAIYDQDRYAWIGTDALLAAVPQERLRNGVGWIVVDRGDAHVVRFGQGDADHPRPLYDVTFRSGVEPTVEGGVVTEASGDFSDAEQAMFRAAILARSAIRQRCTQNYNTVLLPDPDGEGWLVWMLAATTDPNIAQTGGHYRVSISADGRTIEQADALSRGCGALPMSSGSGGRPEALMTTQLVSDVPVETFVFLSLSHRIPIYVMTPDQRVWSVEGDRMRTVQTDS